MKHFHVERQEVAVESTREVQHVQQLQEQVDALHREMEEMKKDLQFAKDFPNEIRPQGGKEFAIELATSIGGYVIAALVIIGIFF